MTSNATALLVDNIAIVVSDSDLDVEVQGIVGSFPEPACAAFHFAVVGTSRTFAGADYTETSYAGYCRFLEAQ